MKKKVKEINGELASRRSAGAEREKYEMVGWGGKFRGEEPGAKSQSKGWSRIRG